MLQIPSIFSSLRADVVAGKITIREAAVELFRAGHSPYIDEDYTKRALNL